VHSRFQSLVRSLKRDVDDVALSVTFYGGLAVLVAMSLLETQA
jgi:hypothetical protein